MSADSCMSVQTVSHSSQGLHSVHPAHCFMQNGSLVNVCTLNENGRSHPMIRKNHQGIRREAKGHGNPTCNKANKNQT